MKQNSIYKKALYLAVPMMIQNGITNAVSLVDNLMVGSLGTEKMTAVSIAGQLFLYSFLLYLADCQVLVFTARSISDREIKKAIRRYSA